MLQVFRKGEKGFTLIELLVVIAIIGVLSTIVLVSLNTARQKARDVRRVSDMRQVALALEMYYDSNTAYPSDAGVDNDEWGIMDAALEGGGFVTSVPTDPVGTNAYVYHSNGAGVNNAQEYVLGAILEDTSHSALDSDLDVNTFGCPCAGAGEYCVKP